MTNKDSSEDSSAANAYVEHNDNNMMLEDVNVCDSTEAHVDDSDFENSNLSTQEATHDETGDVAIIAGYHLQEYRIEKVLGIGGFGISYLATDINLNARVAIKEYLPESLAYRRQDLTVHPRSGSNAEIYEWGLKRFINEARILAAFRHPNILQVLRFFEANRTAYMVMEFVSGNSFTDWIKENKSKLSQDQILDIILPLLDGLSVVHEANFLHRDIKPDNINVRSDGTPVLLDFGAAESTTSEDELPTILTPGFAPVEQYDNAEKQGAGTDIYAMGAVLYWVVMGKKPLAAPKRAEKNQLVLLQKTVKSNYRKPFLRAIDWALNIKREDRPTSMQDFAAALVGNKDLAKNWAQHRNMAQTHAKALRRRIIGMSVATLMIIVVGIAVYAFQGGFKKPVLIVNSTPTGATFFIDGFRIGVTPKEIQELPNGDHTIKIVQALFQEYERNVSVTVGQTRRVHGHLEKLPWQLKISPEPPEPGSAVYVDGMMLGVTPLTIDKIAAGNHKIEVKKEGLFWQGEVDIAADPIIIHPVLNVDKERKNRIEQLLAKADRNVKAGRLDSPKVNNALMQYKEILDLDPRNQPAASGITNIVQVFLMLFHAAVLKHDVIEAENYLNHANNVQPWADGIREAQQRLEEMTANAKQDDFSDNRQLDETVTPIMLHDSGKTRQIKPGPYRQEIKRLLSKAELAIKAKRFVSPKAKNASFIFAKILKLDPENAAAKAGFYRIANEIVMLAYLEKKQKNDKKAKRLEGLAGSVLVRLHHILEEQNNQSTQLVKALSSSTATTSPKSSSWVDPIAGISFTRIEQGCFKMGSENGDKDEQPVHKMCVDSYWMGTHEITQRQWHTVMASNPSNFNTNDQHPVESVSWQDARTFIAKLNNLGDVTYRLPSEAEWEFACRVIAEQPGQKKLDAGAWFNQSETSSHNPVGQKQPNSHGLYDMQGNVAEWVENVYVENAYRHRNDRDNSSLTTHFRRVVRGGHWMLDAESVSCTYRNYGADTERSFYNGLRLVRKTP